MRLSSVHRVVISSALAVCLGVAAYGLTRPSGPTQGSWQALGITGISVAIVLGAYLVWFRRRHIADRERP
jgi:hypothetical protein